VVLRLYSSFNGSRDHNNVVAVLVGGGIGALVGARFPEAIRHTAMQAIGIVTLLVGIATFLEFNKNAHTDSTDLNASSRTVRTILVRSTKRV
jgi:uncharacterized membrane protein YfcA